jgi:NADH:ubiquinone oxidoreductase subunit E
METLKKHLDIDMGEVTEDGLFSIQPARCVGACGLAPVMMIDERIFGDLTPERTIEIIEEYRKKNQNEQ